MSTSVPASRYNDLEATAAGTKTNIRKRLAGPDIFPNSKRPKLNNVRNSVQGAAVNISQPFVPQVSPNIRAGSAAQLLRQVGNMSGNMPALAYAHVPIYTINPKFRPSKFITPIAEEGELTMAFHLSNRQPGTSDFTTGGGLRMMNWILALLTLDRGQFIKEGYDADLNLLQLNNPEKITDLCALLGPVYIPEQGAARVLKPKSTNPAEFVVQVFGLAEGQTMKDIWPEAPVDSQLFIELREVPFDRCTSFQISRTLKLEERLFVNGRAQNTYQFVPTFIPPNLKEYMENYINKDAYANPSNYKVPVGKLVHRSKDSRSGYKSIPTPTELSRGIGWISCGVIKVILSTHMFWQDPIGIGEGGPGISLGSPNIERHGRHSVENLSDEDQDESGDSSEEEEEDDSGDDRMDEDDNNDVTAIFK